MAAVAQFGAGNAAGWEENGDDVVFIGGNVGIGTSNPQYTLDVSGTIRTDSLLIQYMKLDTGLIIIDTTAVLLAIDPGSGSTKVPFTTKDSSGAWVLYQAANGNLGLGTNAPAVQFHMHNTTSTVGRLSNTNSASGVLQWQLFNDASKELSIGKLGSAYNFGGVGSGAILNRDGNFNIWQDGNDPIRFLTDVDDSQDLTASEKMRLSPAGNLGIGTTTPYALLSVNSSTDSLVFINGDQDGSGATSADSIGLSMLVTGNVGMGRAANHAINVAIANGSAGISAVNTIADELVIESDDTTGISLRAADDKATVLLFGSASNTGTNLGRIVHANTDKEFELWTKGIKAATLDSLQNLGIGTTEPAYNLTVVGAAGDGIMVTGEATPAASDSAVVLHLSSAGGGQISLIGPDGDTGNVTVNSADGMLFENFANYSTDNDVGIGVVGDRGSRLYISDTENTVFVPSDGAFGETTGSTIRLGNTSTTVGSFSQIAFTNRTSAIASARIAAVLQGSSESDLVFVTEDGTAAERLRITGDGLVGFNTTNPQATIGVVNSTPRFYITDEDINLNQSSYAQATDSAAVAIDVSTAEPTITLATSTGDVSTYGQKGIGEMSMTFATTSVATTTDSVWVRITSEWVQDHTPVNTTFDTDSITVTYAGTYKLECDNISFSGTATGIYEFAFGINGTPSLEHLARRTTAVSDVGSTSLGGQHTLSAGDGISLWVRNLDLSATGAMTPLHVTLSVERLY
jgi:hypothetical protein